MPSAERMGIDASAPSGYFRFSDESAFPLPGSDRLQVTASRISIAYFRDAQGKYVSVNAAALYWAFLIGISDVDPRGESFLGYDGFGLYSTIPFLPQLLTNWSVRYDLVRKHLGIQVGPTTEYLAGKRDFRVLSQLHGGAYAAIFGIEVGGSMAYDPFRNEERFCMSAYKEFL